MLIEPELKRVKRAIDPFLADFFAHKRQQARKINPSLTVLVDQIAQLTLRGGKRIRPALCLWGYKLSGGKNEEEVLPLACALEVFHVFALVHDDIIDQAKIRRGERTIHEYFTKLGERKNQKELSSEEATAFLMTDLFSGWGDRLKKTGVVEGKHRQWGISLAILAGDLAFAWADELFEKINARQKSKRQALVFFNKLKQEVAYGQYLDVLATIGVRSSLSRFNPLLDEEAILTIYEYKTARYSFEKPLVIGASLAGAEKDLLKAFSQYGIATGIAFQIYDDILGVFGQEAQTGKSTASDIIEGKPTLLFLKTYEFLKKREKQRFLTLYGKGTVTREEMNWLRQMIKDSHALAYCQRQGTTLVKQAKAVFDGQLLTKEAKELLFALGDFTIKRQY